MTSTLEEYFEEHVVRFLTKCGGNEIKYATRGAINKVASNTGCGSTKRKISSSEEDEMEEVDNDEVDNEEEDFDIDEIDDNPEEFSSAGDDEIELEFEEPLVMKPRKSPRKKPQLQKPMKLRSRPQRHRRHHYQSSSAFSNSSDSESEYKGGLVTGTSSRKGKGSVIITSHGRRVKPNPKLRHN